MLRQKLGSLVCPSCGTLVGVNDERCYNCGRWKPGMWGFGPLLTKLGRDSGFTPFVMGACIVMYAATILADTRGLQFGGLLSFLSPSLPSLFLFGASGPVPVFGFGRWWTVLTAGWLHGGILHIAFNLMSLRNVSDPVAEFYGANRMVIIYTLAGVAGFTASTLAGNYLGHLPLIGGGQFTVGASASICGLIGSLFYYGRRAGSRGVSDQAKQWMIMIVGLWFHHAGNRQLGPCRRIRRRLSVLEVSRSAEAGTHGSFFGSDGLPGSYRNRDRCVGNPRLARVS
jgi:rhomboid protease GluP